MSGPLNCVLLKMLIISNRTMTCLVPPSGSTFWNATSVWVLKGVRMSVSVRGALPNVNVGAFDQAAGLNQLAMQPHSGSYWLSVLPGGAGLVPVRVGRWRRV